MAPDDVAVLLFPTASREENARQVIVDQSLLVLPRSTPRPHDVGSWWTRCCSATGACGTSSSRVASRGASASPPRPIRCRTRRAGAGLGAARPQLSAGRSALVALEARDGAVDGGVADGRVVEGDLAVLGGDALRGGGLLRLAVVVELHHRELAGVDLDQRELVVLHGEHGVADGAGLAVAAHDLGGEGGVLAVQRDRDGAVLLARGVG